MEFTAVVKQIRGCSEFFASQSGLLSESSKIASFQSMATSLGKQLANLSSLDAGQAAVLNSEISASGFSAGEKSRLAEAVVNRCLATPSECKALRRGTQTMTTVSAYLAASDWAVLDAVASPLYAKITRIMDRLFLLGLQNPSESTVKCVAAIVACVHCPTAPPNALHNIVQEIKSVASARKGSAGGTPHLTVFPGGPSNLPLELLQGAYSGGDGPVQRDVVGLSGMLARIPLRSTNRTIQVAPARAPSVAPAMPCDAASFMRVMFQHYLQGPCGNPRQSREQMKNDLENT